MRHKKLRLIAMLSLGLSLTVLHAQEIKVSDRLTIIKLTEHTYIHTCENNNGIVHVNKGEVIIVSTPDSDAETKNLIDWTKESLQAKIVGFFFIKQVLSKFVIIIKTN